jgi:RNA polymerase sigma-70 factor (ECF subfamily)
MVEGQSWREQPAMPWVVGRIGPAPEQGDGGSDADRALMLRLRDGDERAMDELLRRYWSPLVAYVANLIDDKAEAEDVVQDTFLDLWNRSPRWDASGSVVAFLYQVARHLALNRARRRRVRWRWAGEVKRRVQAQSQPAALEIIERAELAAAIEEAIQTLPPRRREVFTLAYLHGLRHAEIAVVMGLSRQTTKNQMSAALSQLRQSLRPFLE